MKLEKWEKINGYDGFYEISDLGVVRGLKRKFAKDNILTPNISKHGYLNVCISYNGKQKTHFIHRLVWDYFGNKKRNSRKLQVDHINNNKLDNRINNLQLLTARENTTKATSRIKHKTSSKYIGVRYETRDNTWTARIVIGNKRYYLGAFKDEMLAAKEYSRVLYKFNKTGIVDVTSKAKTSKYLGVYRRKNNKWEANARVKGIKSYIGVYDTEIEAHRARVRFLLGTKDGRLF